jgi:hypothetical protein
VRGISGKRVASVGQRAIQILRVVYAESVVGCTRTGNVNDSSQLLSGEGVGVEGCCIQVK